MRRLFYQYKSLTQKAVVSLLLFGAVLCVSLPIFSLPRIHTQSVRAAVAIPAQPIAQERSLRIAEEAFRGKFGNRASRPSNSLIIIIAGSVLIFLVLALFLGDRYFRRFKIKDGYYNRNSLFREICHAHHFTKHEQKVLWDIAKMLRLENPLDLFVEPKYLEQIVSKRSSEFPLETLRNIFTELFNDGGVVKEVGISQTNDSWFPLTFVAKNPDVQELVYSKGSGAGTSAKAMDQDQDTTQVWDPSFWNEINLIGNGQPTARSEEPQTKAKKEADEFARPPIYVAPPLKAEVEEMQSQTYHKDTQEKKDSWFASK